MKVIVIWTGPLSSVLVRLLMYEFRRGYPTTWLGLLTERGGCGLWAWGALRCGMATIGLSRGVLGCWEASRDVYTYVSDAGGRVEVEMEMEEVV